MRTNFSKFFIFPPLLLEPKQVFRELSRGRLLGRCGKTLGFGVADWTLENADCEPLTARGADAPGFNAHGILLS
jgi:hypothetical protein